MQIQKLCKISNDRQDGAVYGDYLFSFNSRGDCTVYRISDLEKCNEGEAKCFSRFTLDKNDVIAPHSNSVMFGNEFYHEIDEFPLLYTNVYNNYCNEENKLKGVCLVYRLVRYGASFKTTLVQMIEIGFTKDDKLWKSEGGIDDVRPYGNFAIDADKGIYYAFTMRDNPRSTRYFSFELPKACQGKLCPQYNIKRVVLNSDDICDYFDCDYHHYIQGSCFCKSKIYSLEGFTDNSDNPPAIRIIDTNLKKEVFFKKFDGCGLSIEPEMIDFENDVFYYGDHNGNVYKLFFD